MMRNVRTFLAPGLAVCLTGLFATLSALGQDSSISLEKMQKLIAPGPHESQWMQVPWVSSWNIHAARQKAAAEGKPLLLWYMAGEPLGTC